MWAIFETFICQQNVANLVWHFLLSYRVEVYVIVTFRKLLVVCRLLPYNTVCHVSFAQQPGSRSPVLDHRWPCVTDRSVTSAP